MANQQTKYTVETSKGDHPVTTDKNHTKLEDFLKEHGQEVISTLGVGVQIYNV
jgi:hypothetical protein